MDPSFHPALPSWEKLDRLAVVLLVAEALLVHLVSRVSSLRPSPWSRVGWLTLSVLRIHGQFN